MAKRAIVYVRVSSEMQAAEGKGSLGDQGRELKALAKAKGYQLVESPDFEGRSELAKSDPVLADGVFGDPGISGELLEGRPGIMAVLDTVKAGRADAVLIRDTNRLSRRQLVLHQILAVFEAHGTWLVTPTHEYDCNDDNDLMLLGVFGAVDQQVKRALVKNMVRAKDSRRARGIYVDSMMPYGYRWHHANRLTGPGHPEPIPEQVEVVQEIYRLCVDEKMSPADIARTLTERGIHSQKPGSWFDGVSIRVLVGRPYYKGEWCTAEGVLAQHQPPAIVDAKTWKRAQAQIKWWRYRNSGPHVKRNFLLAKLVRCECGGLITGRRCPGPGGEGEYRYYSCARHLRTPKRDPVTGLLQEKCDAVPVKAEALEEPVWAMVTVLAEDPKQIEKMLVATEKDLLPKRKADRKRYQRAIDDRRRRVENLVLLLADEKIAPEEYTKHRTQAELDIDTWSDDLAEIDRAIETEEMKQGAADRVTTTIAEVAGRLDSMTVPEKRDLLLRLGFNITVKKDRSKATVEFAGAALWAAQGLLPALSRDGDGS